MRKSSQRITWNRVWLPIFNFPSRETSERFNELKPDAMPTSARWYRLTPKTKIPFQPLTHITLILMGIQIIPRHEKSAGWKSDVADKRNDQQNERRSRKDPSPDHSFMPFFYFFPLPLVFLHKNHRQTHTSQHTENQSKGTIWYHSALMPGQKGNYNVADYYYWEWEREGEREGGKGEREGGERECTRKMSDLKLCCRMWGRKKRKLKSQIKAPEFWLCARSSIREWNGEEKWHRFSGKIGGRRERGEIQPAQ